MSKPMDITSSDHLLKKMITFSLPLIAVGMIDYCMTLIDLFWLSKLLPQGEEVIASFRSSIAVITLLEGILIGIVSGFIISLTQHYGAKEYQKAQQVFDTGGTMNILIALFISVIGISSLPFILQIFGLSAEAKDLSYQFLLVYFMGYAIIVYKTYLYSTIRNMGESIYILWSLLLMLLFNFLATPLFIKGFLALGFSGMMGASSATILSHFIGICFYLFVINKWKVHLFHIHLSWKSIKSLNKPIIKKVLPMVSAEIFNGISFNLSLFLVTIIVSYYAEPIFASLTIGLYILHFFEIMKIQFATTIFPFVGQNIGARNWEIVNKVIRYAVIMILSVSFLACLIIFFFKKWMISFFATDSHIIVLTSQFLNIYLIPWFLTSSTLVFIFVIAVSGDAKGSTRLIIWNMYLCAILPLIVIPYFFEDKAMGVWIAYSIHSILSFVGTLAYFMKGTWRKARFVDGEPENKPIQEAEGLST